MLNNQSSPNWVLGYAECNLKNGFEELKMIVEHDVKEANRVIDGRQFSLEHSGEDARPIMTVSRSGEADGAVVRFEVSETLIRINGGGNLFWVTPCWDGHRCRMSVEVIQPAGAQERRFRELWEISQMALTNLFFAEWPARSRNPSEGH